MYTQLVKVIAVLAAIVFVMINPLSIFHATVNAQDTSAESGYVLVRVNCLEILSLPTDLLEGNVAQLQLMVFISDGDQIAGTFTFFQDSPDTKTRLVSAGESYCNETDANGPWFAVDKARDQVAVWFLAVDNDDLSEILSTTLDGTIVDSAISFVGEIFNQFIKNRGATAILSRANLLIPVLEVGLGFVVDEWEKPDTIGEYLTVLLRHQGWNQGSYKAMSADGAILIDYDVLLTNEEPQQAANSSGIAVLATLQPASSTVIESVAVNPCPGRTATGSGNRMTLKLNVPDGYVQYLIGSRFDNIYDGVRIRIVGPYQETHRLYNGMFCEPVLLADEDGTREHVLMELATGGQTCEQGDCPIEVVCENALCRRLN